MLKIPDSQYQILDQMDRILGTPSAQKIFRIMVCWEILPVKEIIDLSGLSESQVHATLLNLEKLTLIEKRSRGIYSSTDSSFSQSLKKSYLDQIIPVVGTIIFNLFKKISKAPKEEIWKEYVDLEKMYRPLLKKEFPFQMSSLVEEFIEFGI